MCCHMSGTVAVTDEQCTTYSIEEVDFLQECRPLQALRVTLTPASDAWDAH